MGYYGHADDYPDDDDAQPLKPDQAYCLDCDVPTRRRQLAPDGANIPICGYCGAGYGA